MYLVGCSPDNSGTETPHNSEKSINNLGDNQENNFSDSHKGDSSVSQGGQVVEVANYDLELVTTAENNDAHLDFYLQTRDDYQNVPNADVMADIQLPDGTQRQFTFEYDTQQEHYTFDLRNVLEEQYQMKVTVNFSVEIVSSEFYFNL